MSETFIKSFTHLKDRPHADRALTILQRTGSLVKPIMRKHGWVLPVLAEFFPDSPNLLGLNIDGGQQILVRLRPANSPDTFYDEEHVVGTMLHELTHNVHGPHDDKFYKFLAGLEDEYYALRRSGYAGEGFFSKGQRLGVNVSHDLPLHIAKAKALEAAEKRRKAANIIGSGGRLGGRVLSGRNLTPRQLAAEAAERRAHDEKACGSGAEAQREAKKAAKEGAQHDNVIDLTGDLDTSDPDIIILDDDIPTVSRLPKPVVPAKPSKPRNPSPAVGNSKTPSDSSSLSRRKEKTAHSMWSCPACTLLNEPHVLQCNACLTRRPLDQAAGWMCMTCKEVGIPHQLWTCRFCGTMKTESALG